MALMHFREWTRKVFREHESCFHTDMKLYAVPGRIVIMLSDAEWNGGRRDLFPKSYVNIISII